MDNLEQLDINLVINMIFHLEHPELPSNPGVEVLWLRTIDLPITPIPMRILKRGVEAALPVIRDDGRVLVYCQAGRHRSVAMACCILIGMGYPAEEAMKLVSEKRERADPWIWYIQRRIRKFETYWKKQH
jgi:hypothetical protein